MNTEQNYVGRGNYANNPPQTAENGPQFSSQADNRPTTSLDLIEVNRAVYAAQTKLLELVDEFMQGAYASGPIETINSLLFDWLTMPTTDLINLPRNRVQLSRALELVNFLAKMYEQLDAVQSCLQIQKEVSHE